MAVQEEVTQQVSQSLALQLFPSATVGSRRYARSAVAYDAYLRGRYFWHKMTPDGIRLSMTHFQEALATDSRFAPAYVGLADCYAQMGSVRVGMMKPVEALGRARSHLQKALDLDETLADAHCTLALIKSWYEYDWAGAEWEFQATLALEPGLISALLWQSRYFSAIGKHSDAVASVQRAREIEPLSASVNLYLGVAQHQAGQFDLALCQLQKGIEIDRTYYRYRMFMGWSLCWLHRYYEAIAEHRRALELAPEKGRGFAAWLGLVPRQHSTGGQQKLVGISKRGNCYLRRLLIHGARSVLQLRKSNLPVSVHGSTSSQSAHTTIWLWLPWPTNWLAWHGQYWPRERLIGLLCWQRLNRGGLTQPACN